MIMSFGNQLAKDLFEEDRSRETKRFPAELYKIANRKLQYLNAAVVLKDLRVPHGNRLEQLRGRLSQYHSIRINDQWRIIFRWENGSSHDVQVIDYH